MLAIEFVADRTTKAPVGKLVENIIASARDKGVITIKAGPYGTVIRLLVPLVATMDELETGMGMFSAAVGEACTRP
jgi:4-aminobutyrate aminotransferase/(S)-3-amino-2-methylpropionate transaminase